jgi:hypothetical protein
MFSSLPEQPLTVLDLTGLAFRFWRRNMGAILRFLLVPSIFVTIVGVAFQWVLTYGINIVKKAKDFGVGVEIFCLGALIFVAWMLVWWWLTIRLMALVRLSLGFSATLEEALSFCSAKKWSLALLWLLLIAALFGITIACFGMMASGLFVGGPMRGVAVLVTLSIGSWTMAIGVMIYLLLAHLTICVLACEKEGAIAVVGKSFSMMFKHLARTAGFGLAFMLVYWCVYYPLSLPLGVLTGIDYWQQGVFNASERAAAYQPPVYLLIVSSVWESIIGMLMRPLAVCAWGYFYFDLRMRSEGLDLKRKLDQIEQSDKLSTLP